MNDVAILDDIFLALQPEFTFGLAFGHRAERDQVIVSDNFGADKSALDIGVDFTGGLMRGSVTAGCPGADFILADGKKGLQIEQIVR